MLLANKLARAAGLGIRFVGCTSGAITSTSKTASLTSLVGGLASQPAAGDLVIVCIGGARSTDVTVTVDGYVSVADLFRNDGGTAVGMNFAVAYKVMGSTPDTELEITLGGKGADWTYCVHVWRNVDPVTPMDVTPTTDTNAGNDPPNPPAITPVTNNAMIVALGGGSGGQYVTSTYRLSAMTAPSGMGNLISNAVSAGAPDAASTTGIASVQWPGSGAYSPGQFVGGVYKDFDYSCAVTLALRPRMS